MSDDGPPPEPPASGGPDDPFGGFGLPLFGDPSLLAPLMSGDPKAAARALAARIADQGRDEGNVDPAARMRTVELIEVADLHVRTVTGLGRHHDGPAAEVVTRTEWTDRTVTELEPYLEGLGSVLTPQLPADDPAAAMLGPLLQMVGPMLRAMTAGGLVGHLGTRAFGSFELPVPRPPAPVALVAAEIDGFGSDWSLSADELRLWVAIERLTFSAVLGVPHVRTELGDLFRGWTTGFRNDPERIEESFGAIGPESLADPEALQSMFGDPSRLLDAMVTPEQEALRPRLAAAVATVVGYVDHVLDRAGDSLIGGGYGQLSEALRRRRVEATSADQFVERLFGLDLDRDTVASGQAFVEGVIERAGDDGLGRLWEAPGRFPTPAELEAPGLWLARIDLPDAEA